MNSNVNVFVQQSTATTTARLLSSSSSSSLNVPVAELRRRKISRSNLVGGSTMASATPTDQRVKLERVIGMTVNSVSSLACDSVNGLIAYPAGCTIILYNAKRNRQAHIINAARKNITCVTFSPDGNYLAAAESGHQPSVRVWDVEEQSQVVELTNGHNFGVSCLMFSPDMKYLISVGNQHDNVVNVWNWKSQRKSSSNKVSCKVKSLSFSEDGSYFVTVGVRHVKFWYLERNKAATPKYQDTVPLQGRSAILSDQRNNYFCDVVCGRGPTATKTFAITQSGLLCEFNNKRLLERWLDLKTRCASSVALAGENLLAGCAEGTIHVFKSSDLSYVATFPRPHCLGVDVASSSLNDTKFSKYPDVVAIRFDENRKKLTCIYNDHSLYQWEVGENFKQFGKAYSSMAHSGCIWTVQTYPSAASLLPPGTFFTGGSDDTIRIWNIDPNMPVDTTAIRKNVYSHELLKIVYADAQFAHLCDTELALENRENQYDGKSGIRALKTSPDGYHLATGDRSGNIRIYSIPDFTQLHQLSAHDAEVLCLEYSSPDAGSYFLASSSRDRLLHVLDPSKSYEPVCTIDDHSSSITSVKFARGFSALRPSQSQLDVDDQDDQSQEDLIMLSGGADKSIIMRKLVPDQQGQQQFVRANYVALQSTVYDMDVDASKNTVLAACQDRQIRVYQIMDGKFDRVLKGSMIDENNGTLIKLELDPSCTFVATSTSDKQTFIIDSRSGDFVASMIGHGELVTGLKFSNDFRHLFTVSGDGCIFVWRLATELTNRMLARQMRTARCQPSDVSPADAKDIGEDSGKGEEGPEGVPSDELSESQAPSWARKQVQQVLDDSADDQYQYKPRGRWATSCNQRPEPDGVDSSEGDSSQRRPLLVQGQHEEQGGARSRSVQKMVQQFEVEKAGNTNTSGNAKKTGGGDFGSLMNMRLVGVDEEDETKKDDVVFYSSTVPNEEAGSTRDFVVKERGATGKSYRGAETMGDISDEESGAASSADVGSSLRVSESVGDLHPHHRMVVDAFEKLDNADIIKTENGDSFERGASGRQSITSRYLQRSNAGTPSAGSTDTPQAAPRGRWNTNLPPVIPARVLVTPSTPNSNSSPATAANDSVKSIESETGRSSLVDNATVSRAKALSEAAAKLQNRERRQTFSSFDRPPLSSPRRQPNNTGDYASSELHHRSRSRGRTGQSPTRKPYSALQRDALNDSEDSDFSSVSAYNQRRRTPSSYASKLVTSRSMTSLASHASTPTSLASFNYQAVGTMKRLTDIREKLRKSQENIAFGSGVSGATTPTAEGASSFGDWNDDDRSMAGSRSRSFGNLANVVPSTRKSSTPVPSSSGRSRLASLLESRGITLSTGNLRAQMDAASQVSSGDGRDSRGPGATSSNLIGAIMDFKRSASDLSQCALTNEQRSESVAGSFYGKVATMPKRSATSGVGKKAQAIRSQRLSNAYTTDRMSVSGESEDSCVDYYNGHKAGAGGLVTRSQVITPSVRQRLDMLVDQTANSSRSSSPSFSTQQQKAYDAARQIFEAKHRQSPSAPMSGKGNGGRPVASYLAKILNSNDESGHGDGGHSEHGGNYFTAGGRHQSEGSALSSKRAAATNGGQGQQSGTDRLSAIVDSCDNHFEKMSGHCKDSVNQFRTSLDKVLQAYNMVTDDTDLTEDERDELLRMISIELEGAKERLNHALNQQQPASASARRFEPDGSKDDRSAVASGRRGVPLSGPMQQAVAAAVSPSGGDSRDASRILQEYSDMLVTMIQQKMSTAK